MGLFVETTFTPMEVEAVFQKAFPYARVQPPYTPQMTPVQWEHHIRFGFFEVQVNAYQTDNLPGHAIGDLHVAINASEYDSKGRMPVWRKTVVGLDALGELLQEVREHLMGIAAAIAYIVGKDPPTTHQGPPAKPKKKGPPPIPPLRGPTPTEPPAQSFGEIMDLFDDIQGTDDNDDIPF